MLEDFIRDEEEEEQEGERRICVIWDGKTILSGSIVDDQTQDR